MAQRDFDAQDGERRRPPNWDEASEEDEAEAYIILGEAETMGPQYYVEIALAAVGRWAEIDSRYLRIAEAMIESRLTVLLELFPSFSVEYVRVSLAARGK